MKVNLLKNLFVIFVIVDCIETSPLVYNFDVTKYLDHSTINLTSKILPDITFSRIRNSSLAIEIIENNVKANCCIQLRLLSNNCVCIDTCNDVIPKPGCLSDVEDGALHFVTNAQNCSSNPLVSIRKSTENDEDLDTCQENGMTETLTLINPSKLPGSDGFSSELTSSITNPTSPVRLPGLELMDRDGSNEVNNEGTDKPNMRLALGITISLSSVAVLTMLFLIGRVVYKSRQLKEEEASAASIGYIGREEPCSIQKQDFIMNAGNSVNNCYVHIRKISESNTDDDEQTESSNSSPENDKRLSSIPYSIEEPEPPRGDPYTSCTTFGHDNGCFNISRPKLDHLGTSNRPFGNPLSHRNYDEVYAVSYKKKSSLK